MTQTQRQGPAWDLPPCPLIYLYSGIMVNGELAWLKQGPMEERMDRGSKISAHCSVKLGCAAAAMEEEQHIGSLPYPWLYDWEF